MKLRLLALIFSSFGLLTVNKDFQIHVSQAFAESANPGEDQLTGDDEFDDEEPINNVEPNGQASNETSAKPSPGAATTPSAPPRPSEIDKVTAQLDDTNPLPSAPPSPTTSHKAKKAKAKKDKKKKDKKDSSPKKKSSAKFADGMHTLKSNCNVRSKPNSKGKKLGMKNAGSRTWVGRHDKKWAKIYYKSKLAYVSMECVK